MAKALECPACGARHRLDGLDPAATFRCERCGQKLKIPASVGSAAAVPDGDGDGATASTTASTTTGTAAPPPRRRASSTGSTAVIGASATLSRAERSGADDGGGQPPDGKSRAKRAPTPRRRVKLYWRVVAWIVAVPLGFALTVWPAYEFGLIRKDDVLDVFVGSGADRYTRLAVVTLLWALVTAVLVQVFVEGGRIWADHRRREPTSGVSPARGPRATS